MFQTGNHKNDLWKVKDMQLQQIVAFGVVARSRTFTEAAERLGKTQPAVSMQIRALEKEFGVPLIDVSHRRLHLTAAGAELLRHSDEVLEKVREATGAMWRVRHGGGAVRLAASATPAVYILPERLGLFSRTHPNVDVTLRVANPEAIEHALDAAEADIVLAMGGYAEPPWGSGIETVGLGEDPLLVALPPGDPRSGWDFTLDELRQLRLIAREPGSHARAVVDRAFGSGFHPALEFGSTEAVKRAVAAGLGVAVLSQLSISWEIGDGRLTSGTCREIGGPRRVYLGRRPDRRLIAAEEALWHFLQANVSPTPA